MPAALSRRPTLVYPGAGGPGGNGAYVPVAQTQGGTPGSPTLTPQWAFQPANTTNTPAPFGVAFWPGTFGSVVETSMDLGYNSPKITGHVAPSAGVPGSAQAYLSILPDCGDTQASEIEFVFTAPDGATCFPFQFVGNTRGANTGDILMCLPVGDGSIILGVNNGGTTEAYLGMNGLMAATASSPGSAAFGSTTYPITLSVTGALLLDQRLQMSGTAGVSNSLNFTLGGASAPAGVDAAFYLHPASGQNAIVSWSSGGTEEWRWYTNGTDGNLYVYDAVNSRNPIQVFPGVGVTGGKLFVNTNLEVAGNLGFYGKTPIAQPSAVGAATGYAAGTTAGTFHEDDTYTGNTGTTGYTINGIVAALKNLGLVAA